MAVLVDKMLGIFPQNQLPDLKTGGDWRSKRYLTRKTESFDPSFSEGPIADS